MAVYPLNRRRLRKTALLVCADGVRGAQLRQQMTRIGWSEDTNADMVIIDGRIGIAPAMKALETHRNRSNALLFLYPASIAAQLDQIIDAGATHVLRLPVQDDELSAMADLALRQPATTRGRDRNIAPRKGERDPLTGLLSEKGLRQRLSAWFPDTTTVLIANLARYDVINATYGSEAADGVLRGLARRIETLVGEVDGIEASTARMAGAQFAVAFRGGISGARLRLLADAIIEAVERPYATGQDVIHLGARIVAIESGRGDRTVQALLRRAGQELAERRGESDPVSLVVRDAADHASTVRSLHGDLRVALANDQIDILFQPQVGISSGQIVGVEALARWNHPELGPVGANTLFTVAQQSDYLRALSVHCQRKALELAADWGEALQQLRLSVNVMATDIARPRFVREFLDMVEMSGFPKERLTIEITETGAMADLPRAARVLGQLRAAGCRVAIDDFGTGYSSLAWLKELPADYIKLDKGLTGDISGTDRDAVVVKGVIAMARSLGLSVIAEGVETEGQLALLSREGAALYQGFLHSPAIDGASLARLLLKK
jgi:EAL domain-containing protein (putative c-di-GMP-specific phosphodiesterase class I)/GGDEF domain-containing protein